MLHKNNTEELYDTKMLLFKDGYLRIFSFSVWGYFADTQSSCSAPGLCLKRPLLMNKYMTKNNIASLIHLHS